MMPLIIVPIRSNSQGLPDKQLRLLGGVPVAERVLRMLQTIPHIELAVSTNDGAMIQLCNQLGVRWIVRPHALCGPDVTLDPVAYHAWRKFASPGVLVTVQATAPFLHRETVLNAISAISNDGGYDTATVVVDDRHLRWEGDRPPARINRQQMPPAWRETAAVCATRGEFVTPTSRFGPRVKLIEVSGAEAVDLDTPEDWAVAEWYAGVPSNRECLMARVLGERLEAIRGRAIVLSASDEPPQDAVLRFQYFRSLSPDSIHLNGPNTWEEARQAIQECQEHDLTIVTSAYHQVRAFLTFLRVLQDRALERTVHLWNAPAPSRMEPLAEEWAKITEYQGKGHVASYEDGLLYLNWRDAVVPCAIS